MTLAHNHADATDESDLRALVEYAAPILCEELEARFSIRTGGFSTRAARLRSREAGNVFNRPTLAWIATFPTPGDLPLTLGLIIRERDHSALIGQALTASGSMSSPDALATAVAHGIHLAVEARTCSPWHEFSCQPIELATLLATADEFETASCWLEVESSVREICVLACPGALDLLRAAESNVVVALRPRLAPAVIAARPPGEIDHSQLEAIPVDVRAVLPTTSISLGRVAALRSGDTLKLSDDWDQLVRLVIGGCVVATGELVVVEGRWAVLVQHIGEAGGT